MVGSLARFVRRMWGRYAHDKVVAYAAILILGVDVLLGLIHIVVLVFWDIPNIWRVDMDGSYAEAYQYVKYFWIVLLLAVYARRARRWPVAAWIPLFLYFLVDDALMLHELFGFWYHQLPWAFGIGPVSAQTVGELALSGAVLLVVLVPLVFGYRAADPDEKDLFKLISGLVAALLVFAVVVDVIHAFFNDIRVIDRSVGFVEDFGEMLILSTIVLVTIGMNSVSLQTAPEPGPGKFRARPRVS